MKRARHNCPRCNAVRADRPRRPDPVLLLSLAIILVILGGLCWLMAQAA